jgi:hypothetical protein
MRIWCIKFGIVLILFIWRRSEFFLRKCGENIICPLKKIDILVNRREKNKEKIPLNTQMAKSLLPSHRFRSLRVSPFSLSIYIYRLKFRYPSMRYMFKYVPANIFEAPLQHALLILFDILFATSFWVVLL